MNALNTINGFQITERAITSQALNHKLAEYREYLQKVADEDYADMVDAIKGQIERIENILVSNKALTPIA